MESDAINRCLDLGRSKQVPPIDMRSNLSIGPVAKYFEKCLEFIGTEGGSCSKEIKEAHSS